MCVCTHSFGVCVPAQVDVRRLPGLLSTSYTEVGSLHELRRHQFYQLAPRSSSLETGLQTGSRTLPFTRVLGIWPGPCLLSPLCHIPSSLPSLICRPVQKGGVQEGQKSHRSLYSKTGGPINIGNSHHLRDRDTSEPSKLLSEAPSYNDQFVSFLYFLPKGIHG